MSQDQREELVFKVDPCLMDTLHRKMMILYRMLLWRFHFTRFNIR